MSIVVNPVSKKFIESNLNRVYYCRECKGPCKGHKPITINTLSKACDEAAKKHMPEFFKYISGRDKK